MAISYEEKKKYLLSKYYGGVKKDLALFVKKGKTFSVKEFADSCETLKYLTPSSRKERMYAMVAQMKDDGIVRREGLLLRRLK